MLQQEGNPLPGPPTHQPQEPACEVEMLWVALTPNSFLPNHMLPITPLQILQQLAVCKVELLLVWLVRRSAQRPFCLSFFAYMPISTANHTHWSLQNQMQE